MTLLHLVTLTMLAVTPLNAMKPADVDAFLKTLPESPYAARLLAVAKAAAGTPYAGNPLGEGPLGTNDRDPLMDLSRVDCVTFVEQTCALAGTSRCQDAFNLLQRIRYKGNAVSFEARNHFFISDWIADNPWCVDVTKELGVETQNVTRTISRKDFFVRVKAPDLGQDTPDREQTVAYIPVASAAAAAVKFPDATLVVFIGKKPEWLFALHAGLCLRDADGTQHLYHASSKSEAVAAVDFVEYIGSQAERYLGFTAYRVEAPAPVIGTGPIQGATP